MKFKLMFLLSSLLAGMVGGGWVDAGFYEINANLNLS